MTPGRSGDTSIAGLRDRQRATVIGDIVAVTRSVPGSRPRLDLDVDDGTGTVAVRFLGQRDVPGLFPGRRVVITGRFADVGAGGLIVFNPVYRLLNRSAAPAEGPHRRVGRRRTTHHR